MRFLKGVFFSLALLFINPGELEATPLTPTGDRRRRIANPVLAQCRVCGFSTYTEGGMARHICSGHGHSEVTYEYDPVFAPIIGIVKFCIFIFIKSNIFVNLWTAFLKCSAYSGVVSVVQWCTHFVFC